MKVVDSLKKIIEEQNNVKQNQLSEIQPQLHYRKQIVEIERWLSDEEQYTRTECVELVGLPTEFHGDQLEDHVVDVFRTAGIEVKKRRFHGSTDWKQKSCDSKTSEPARCAKYFERKEKVTKFR